MNFKLQLRLKFTMTLYGLSNFINLGNIPIRPVVNMKTKLLSWSNSILEAQLNQIFIRISLSKIYLKLLNKLTLLFIIPEIVIFV